MERLYKVAGSYIVSRPTFPGRSYGTAPMRIEHRSR